MLFKNQYMQFFFKIFILISCMCVCAHMHEHLYVPLCMCLHVVMCIWVQVPSETRIECHMPLVLELQLWASHHRYWALKSVLCKSITPYWAKTPAPPREFFMQHGCQPCVNSSYCKYALQICSFCFYSFYFVFWQRCFILTEPRSYTFPLNAMLYVFHPVLDRPRLCHQPHFPLPWACLIYCPPTAPPFPLHSSKNLGPSEPVSAHFSKVLLGVFTLCSSRYTFESICQVLLKLSTFDKKTIGFID